MRPVGLFILSGGEDARLKRSAASRLDTDTDPSRRTTYFLPVKIEDLAGL